MTDDRPHPRGGGRQRAPAAARPRAARGVPRRARARRAATLEVEPVGEGHSNVTYADRPRRRASSCCAARRGRRCRPARTTCCARRACCARWSRPRRACPRCSPSCDDEAVIGAPFYVMERVEGDVITDRRSRPRSTAPSERRRIGEELIDALVEVHAVDWQARGLEGFGKPTGYLERQLRRFTGPLGAQRARARSRRVETRRRAGCGEHCRSPARPRSCTATTASAT